MSFVMSFNNLHVSRVNVINEDVSRDTFDTFLWTNEDYLKIDEYREIHPALINAAKLHPPCNLRLNYSPTL